MAIPTDDVPTWATAGGADIDVPSTQRQANGWIAEDIPPAGEINWFWNLLAQWVGWLRQSAARYTKLEDAINDTVVGDTVVLDENGSSDQLGSSYASGQGALNMEDADTTGLSIILLPEATGNPYEVDRQTMLTTVRTFVKTTAGVSNQRVRSDGYYVVAAYGQYIECWRRDTGASLWQRNLGATFSSSDICIHRGEVIVVGTDSGAGVNVFSLSRSAGTISWSKNHGAAAQACCARGDLIFICGSASSFASGATLRALRFSNGADATGEMGTADTTSTTWNVVQAVVQARRRTLATNGKFLFLGYSSTAAVQWEARSLANGGAVYSQAIAGYSTNTLAVDQDHCYWVGASGGGIGRLFIFNGDGAGIVYRQDETAVNLISICSDGTAFYLIRNNVGATAGIMRRYRDNRVGLWRRMDPTVSPDNLMSGPLQQLMIPGA